MIDAPADLATRTGAPIPLVPVAIDGLFGWFSPGVTRRGIVLCGTLGFEQLSAHRSWRALSERIAATGCSVLRFDYPGQGDSGDDGAGRVAPCIAAIRRAIRYLREQAGAEEIALIGLRLGATFAALAAEPGGVDRLALLAPVVSGRGYLREMKLQSRTLGRLPDGAPLPQEPGHLTIGGFRLDPDLTGDLSAIDLAGLAKAPAPRVLIVGEAGPLAARCRALGGEVTTRGFPGFAQLVANPLFAVTPDEAFSAVVDFVAADARPRLAGPAHPPASRAIEGAAWIEDTVRFGPGLVGIACRPRLDRPQGPTVLFVNAGTNVRSGWGRQTTALARRLAAENFGSLRIDLRGVGDSADRADGASPLYAMDTLEDVRLALDHLETRGPGPFVVVGACSGAYLAFHAVCREPRLAAALAVNLYCFDWNPQDRVEDVIRNNFRSASTYASLLRDGEAWKRILRGEVRVAAILVSLAKSARERALQRLARLVGPGPVGGSVVRRIANLHRRGARLRLVYSAGDRGLVDLHAQLGGDPAKCASRLGEAPFLIEGADHDLSTAGAQDRLAVILQDLLVELTPPGDAGRGRMPTE